MACNVLLRVLRPTTSWIAVLGIVAFGGPASAYRDPPPDASGPGPNATVTAEYRFPAVIDADIIAGRVTEVWARVYRPDPLPDNSPLLVFLHGNHFTCGRCAVGMPDADGHCASGPRIDDNGQYTTSGTCPANYVVTPNHAGYGYMATQLASWGYLVVSINVNRGINAASGILGDNGLNLVRGRMILRHLELLSRWNQGLDPTPDSLGIDLTGKIDFSNVGLLGHSRGGEGIRAAYQQYRDGGSIWPPRIGPVTFKGMFEIGPVDGQTSRVLTPDGTNWEVLLPMCDGDVSNLQGIQPYDRVRYTFTDNPATQKGNSTVYGANHNYFNTEWQQSDSGGCSGPSNPPIFSPALIGSPQQQQVAQSLAMALFRGAVGPSANPLFLDTFDPLYTLPPTLSAVTRVDQGFTFSPRSPDVGVVLENFTSAATFTTSNLGSFATGTLTEHSAARRVGLVTWTFADSTVYLESDWASGPIDVSGYSIFEFDVDRQQNPLNPATPTNFHVQLVQGDGSLSDPLSANNYAVVDGPQGGPGGIHAMLKTARIPLGDFTTIDLTQIAGVRFTFDDTTSGAIFLSTVAVDMAPPPGMGAVAAVATSFNSLSTQQMIPANVYTTGNTIEGARLGKAGDLGMVILDIATETGIAAKDELTIVKIGSEEFELVDYRDGDPHRLSVMIPEDRFFTLAQNSDVVVQYGRGNGYGDKWTFPALNNATLNR
jgi:hypothetical protein